MKLKNRYFVSALLVSTSLIILTGCAGPPRRPSRTVVLETLETQLYSPDNTVAEQAALALFSSKSDNALRILKDAIAQTDSSSARAAVLVTFTIHEDPRIRYEAEDALGDPNPRTVNRASEYLVKVIGEKAAPDLLSRARDESRSAAERVACIKVVAEYGRKDSVEGLLDLLEDRNGDVRDAAVAALKEITFQPFSDEAELWRSWYRQNRNLTRDEWRVVGEFYYKEISRLESLIESLQARVDSLEAELVALSRKYVDLAVSQKRQQDIIDVLTSVDSVEAQIYAAGKLGILKAKEAVPILEKKAASPDARLVRAALSSLGEIRDPDSLVTVASHLKDEDPGVRLAAVRAYGQMPDSDLKILLPFCEDPSPNIRAAVADTFGGRKWEPGFEALMRALKDTSPAVRAAAARALGLIDDKAAVPELLKLVDDPDSAVAFEAVLSLSDLPDPGAYDALIRATGHDDSSVREAAVVALEKVLPLDNIDQSRAIDRLFELSLSDVDPRVADRAWKALVPLLGSQPAVILDGAQRFMDVDRFDRAEALLKILADRKDIDGDVLQARRMLARTYLERGNNESALLYFRQIQEADRLDPEATAGVKSALEALGDYKGLAAVYARELAAGNATPEREERFSDLLGTLRSSGDDATVAALAGQVLSSQTALSQGYRDVLVRLRTEALSADLQRLIAALGESDTAAAEAARSALSGYGQEAAGALVEALESQSVQVRTAAIELLAALNNGVRFNYEPTLDPAKQQEALQSWRAWLAAGNSHQQ